jgi:hypothetical protein
MAQGTGLVLTSAHSPKAIGNRLAVDVKFDRIGHQVSVSQG